jgi:hypothetical protein
MMGSLAGRRAQYAAGDGAYNGSDGAARGRADKSAGYRARAGSGNLTQGAIGVMCAGNDLWGNMFCFNIAI